MKAYSGLYHSVSWHRQTILSLLLKSIKSVPIYQLLMDLLYSSEDQGMASQHSITSERRGFTRALTF